MFVGNVKDMPKVDMTPGGAIGTVKQVALPSEMFTRSRSYMELVEHPMVPIYSTLTYVM